MSYGDYSPITTSPRNPTNKTLASILDRLGVFTRRAPLVGHADAWKMPRAPPPPSPGKTTASVPIGEWCDGVRCVPCRQPMLVACDGTDGVHPGLVHGVEWAKQLHRVCSRHLPVVRRRDGVRRVLGWYILSSRSECTEELRGGQLP